MSSAGATQGKEIPMSNCWVVKWNRNGKDYGNLERDWTRFLSGRAPFTTFGYDNNNASKGRFRRAERGDVVFCYQTDSVSIVWVCRIADKDENTPKGWCLELRPELQLDPPINIPRAKIDHPEINKAKAFRRGAMLVIYGLEEDEAKVLFETCGLNPSRSEPQKTPPDNNSPATQIPP